MASEPPKADPAARPWQPPPKGRNPREEPSPREAPPRDEAAPHREPAEEADPARGREEQQEPHGPPWYKRRWVIPAAIVLGIALLVGGAFLWWYLRTYESTDDAYTDGHVVDISTQVAGRVQKVYANDNEDVEEGQVLVELDPADYRQQLNQAEAELKVAQAEADRANAVLLRTQRVSGTGAVSPQDYDENLAAARKANAQVNVDRAAADSAKLKLSYTRVLAPFSGRIARKNVEPGAYVTPGQAMMSLVDPQVWVEANFKETQLKLMKPGDKVRVKIDAYPQLVLHGHIDSIQPRSGARFSVLPAENATGNFVKVVQRVPVKIVFDDYTPGQPVFLGVGLSVKPRVTVR